jgi:hypothetical protein
MLTIGILGLGEGRSTISAALQSDRVKLRMICDVDVEKCKHRAKEFQFDHYTTSYQEMLDDPLIDLIAIYTPDHLHATHVMMALQQGKHVLCTKPFIDDLGKERLTSRMASDLFAIVDERTVNRRTTIISTNFNGTTLLERFENKDKETGVAFIRRLKDYFKIVGCS